MMLKRFLCLLAALCCGLCLTGCTSMPENSGDAAATLPPALPRHAAPLGDDGLAHTAVTPLFLPSSDGRRLVTEYITLPLNHGVHSAETIVQALLAHPGSHQADSLAPGGVLSLYGAAPVEVSGGVCTINLAPSALQLNPEALHGVCAAMAATLCQLDDVHYINLLVADRAVGMDISGHLPLGSQTAHPGEELTALWEQMAARRTPLGENPADTPVTAVATLYFPLPDGAGMVAETRTLSFAGQSPDQLAAGLTAALSAGALYTPGAAPMPNLADLMSAAPQTTELDDGGRRLTLRFHPGLEEALARAGMDLPCFVSSLTWTLSSFIPSVTAVQIYIGDTPLTSLYSAVHGNLIFQNGQILRQQFAPYLMEQVTLCFSTGERLVQVRRALPYRQAHSPRALLTELMRGPTQAELETGYEPVLPDGLTGTDILGVALEGDTLIINLSSRCAELLRTQAAAWEQVACYGMVNTLCQATGTVRVCFYFDGQMVEELGGTLYWGGEFMLNPGLYDQNMG